MIPTRRAALLVAGVAALATAAFQLPLDTVPAAVARLGPVAPVMGVLVGAALLVALVPRTPVSVACGLLFGTTLGPVTALAVMVVAAAVTFTAGRLLGRDFARHVGSIAASASERGADRAAPAQQSIVGWAGRLAGRRVARAWVALDRWISREGVLAVAAVRSLPLAPYGLIGYAYGTSGVRVRDYAVGTVLAGSPSAVTYALLGAALGMAGEASPLTLLPLGIGIVLTAVVALRARLRVRGATVARASRTGPPPPSTVDFTTGGTTPGR